MSTDAIESGKGMLNPQDFLNVVKNTPLVSIDLVVCSPQRRILMGKRINRPAAGYWFVPGGRIYKNESLPEAFRRISAAELGTACDLADAELLGAFTHRYDDNFAGAPDIGTHYVVLAYQMNLEAEQLPLHLPVDQHRGYCWVGRDDEAETHPNSQAYFAHLR